MDHLTADTETLKYSYAGRQSVIQGWNKKKIAPSLFVNDCISDYSFLSYLYLFILGIICTLCRQVCPKVNILPRKMGISSQMQPVSGQMHGEIHSDSYLILFTRSPSRDQKITEGSGVWSSGIINGFYKFFTHFWTLGRFFKYWHGLFIVLALSLTLSHFFLI